MICSSVQFSFSVVSDSLRPHESQHARPPCPSPSHGVHSNTSVESVMPSNHLILCRPLLLPLSVFPSIRVFSRESVLHIRWPKYWSFRFSINPSNEYSGLISFRIDCCSPCSPRDSQESFSSSTIQKYQFFSAQPSLWSYSHIYT